MILYRQRPPYESQTRPNTCWAACLKMWLMSEIGTSYSQDQIVASAGSFDLGPGGIDVDSLGRVIDDVTRSLTISMYWRKVERPQDLPYIDLIVKEVGCVYLGYRRPSGQGGHVNVVFGVDGTQYAVLDPDPEVGAVLRQQSGFITQCPAFVGWRMTSAIVGQDYTGRAPWDYHP